MRILETVSELQQLSDAERAAGRRIALVPTMGALHPGHLSLVKVARERADRVWVSIFVNPTQFNDPNDLSAYPRSLDADLEACELAGVDVVFRPDAGEMYPSDGQTTVEVGGLCEPLCGRARPGHFRGVTTIVSKLLLAAKPHVAVFGEKDYQQLAVIRRMVRDLGFGVEVVGAATLREADGLAMSSRNANLDPEARRQAVALVRALDAAEAAAASGETDRDQLLALARAEIARASLASIDYAELCDPDSLAAAPSSLKSPALLALAVYFEPSDATAGSRVRLIDNRVLPVQHNHEDPSS
ncbi:MAG: pantoate--beta-alanine ligase [Deltaproteobacteria bacterium]|nr:pantoate--beta-alanine ligase [Deltaproteobacteria bacterium]